MVELAAANVRNDERHNHVSMYEKALKASQAQVASLDEEVSPAISFSAHCFFLGIYFVCGPG